MKIVGFAQGAHDAAYCIFEDGKVLVHEELERFTRVKEGFGDVIEFFFERNPDIKDVDVFTHFTMDWKGGLKSHFPESWKKLQNFMNNNFCEFIEVSHHKAHAANAFFSSNFEESLIVTVDGGGEEREDGEYSETALTVYKGEDNKIELVAQFPFKFNIGTFWSKITKDAFGFSAGPPIGNQCGTVMAMAAVAKEPLKFQQEILQLFVDVNWNEFSKFKDLSEEDKFNLAGSLQHVTEQLFRSWITPFVNEYLGENLCVAGGVALNSLMMGKLLDWFPKIKNVYIPPVPYDAGLAIGCAQHIFFYIKDHERVLSDKNFSPYMGKEYSTKEIMQAVHSSERVRFNTFLFPTEVKADEFLLHCLKDGKVASVFGGGSESGRRALGNRSIFADPTNKEIKKIVNEKVKHRQWFRPFAPVLLRESVSRFFKKDVDSPYMQFVLEWQDNVKESLPGVVHLDGTGRLQTVTESDNRWLYHFLKKWEEKSGFPVLLNTSFNDSEPIVEKPEHAINCFLKTNIDLLYFYDSGIILEKVR